MARAILSQCHVHRNGPRFNVTSAAHETGRPAGLKAGVPPRHFEFTIELAFRGTYLPRSGRIAWSLHNAQGLEAGELFALYDVLRYVGTSGRRFRVGERSG